MTFTCPCGTSFEARHPRAKYCSDRCRKRAQRTSAPALTVVAPPELGEIEKAVESELTTAGRLESSLGQLSLALARRLDHPGPDTGSAFAAVSRQLAVTMRDATRGVAPSTSPQALKDELAERRAQQGAGHPRTTRSH